MPRLRAAESTTGVGRIGSLLTTMPRGCSPSWRHTVGCDIHAYAEAKVGGGWAAVGHVFDNEYHDPNSPTLIYQYDGVGEWESNRRMSEHPYDGRNYHLFAILAGVRNYNRVTPIAAPRGLPEDVSGYVKHQSDSLGCDGHSHSHLTLAELEAYDWAGPQPDTGVVSPEGFQEYIRSGRPDSWSRGPGGKTVVMVSNTEMVDIVANPRDDGMSYYTQVQWEWAPIESTKSFVEQTIPSLRSLLAKKGVEDIRMVFFFDS